MTLVCRAMNYERLEGALPIAFQAWRLSSVMRVTAAHRAMLSLTASILNAAWFADKNSRGMAPQS